MTQSIGRRERKKAATRQKIADTAMRMFLEQGYDAVGIRDVAAAADVAVTTLFAHFPSKEALVFERDEDFEQRLVRAAGEQPLIPALEREIAALVRHCASDGAAPTWRMIDSSPALREYDELMRLRHAEALATALAGGDKPSVACRTLARFTIDAYSLARNADDPEAALDEIFRMIEAAWTAARPTPQ